MSKKKKKKKKILRLRELKSLEQKSKEGVLLQKETEQPKRENNSYSKIEPQSIIAKNEDEKVSVFRKDLKRIFIVITTCLVVLTGLIFIFKYTALFSQFNFLLPK